MVNACTRILGCHVVVLSVDSPYAGEVLVYGASPLTRDPPRGYRHTPRQYNARFMD